MNKQNKNKKKLEFTVKNVNKIGAIVVFILVFIFTFLVTNDWGRQNAMWIGIGCGSALFVAIVVWVILALVARNKALKADPNKGKIKEALSKLDKEDKDAKDNLEISRAEKAKKEEKK